MPFPLSSTRAIRNPRSLSSSSRLRRHTRFVGAEGRGERRRPADQVIWTARSLSGKNGMPHRVRSLPEAIRRRPAILRRASALVTLERIHGDADVLVVTSGWPRAENPAHCVFVRRQMDSLAERGVRYETLFIHGYRSPLAYFVAAARLAALNARAPRYRVVHAHGGEAALAAYCYRRGPVVVSYLGGDLLGNSYRPDATMSLGARVTRRTIRYGAYLATATITKSPEMHRALPRPRGYATRSSRMASTSMSFGRWIARCRGKDSGCRRMTDSCCSWAIRMSCGNGTRLPRQPSRK